MASAAPILSKMHDISGTNSRYFDIGDVSEKLLLPISGYEKTPLVSLENAVEPIKDFLDDIQTKVYIAKQNCRKPSDGLTQDESSSIHVYTMEWLPRERCLYVVLNKTLRAENRNLLVPWFSYLKLLMTALYKLVSIKCVLWRGIRGFDLSEQYEEGQSYTWWNISSCTDSLSLMKSSTYLGNQGIRTLFNIECQNGKSICRHSYFEKENEILLMPATHFKVLGKVKSSDGLNIIHVRETQPPYQLIKPPFTTVTDETTIMAANLRISLHANKNASREILDLTKQLRSKTGPKEVNLHGTVYPWDDFVITATTKHLTIGDIEVLCEALKQNHTVVKLDLMCNGITDEGAKLLAEVLSVNTTISELDLRTNIIGDEGCVAIATALGINHHLRVLYLVVNNITHRSCEAVKQMLKQNATLKKLDFYDNPLGDKGVELICKGLLVNKSLTALALSKTNISHLGLQSIAQMLQLNKTLKRLDVSFNDIDDDGVNIIAMGLKLNVGLIFLNFDANSISDNGIPWIIELLNVNETLQGLVFMP